MSEQPSAIPPFEYLMDQYDPITRSHDRGLKSAGFVTLDGGEEEHMNPTFESLVIAKDCIRDIINTKGEYLPNNRSYLNWIRSSVLGRDAVVPLAKLDSEKQKAFFDTFSKYQFSFMQSFGEGLLLAQQPIAVPLLVATNTFKTELTTILADATGNPEWEALGKKASTMTEGSKIIFPGWGSTNAHAYELTLKRDQPMPDMKHILLRSDKYHWKLHKMSDFEIAEKMLVPARPLVAEQTI